MEVTMTANVEMKRVAPILPVRDVSAALAHYRQLGFEVRARLRQARRGLLTSLLLKVFFVRLLLTAGVLASKQSFKLLVGNVRKTFSKLKWITTLAMPAAFARY